MNTSDLPKIDTKSNNFVACRSCSSPQQEKNIKQPNLSPATDLKEKILQIKTSLNSAKKSKHLGIILQSMSTNTDSIGSLKTGLLGEIVAEIPEDYTPDTTASIDIQLSDSITHITNKKTKIIMENRLHTIQKSSAEISDLVVGVTIIAVKQAVAQPNNQEIQQQVAKIKEYAETILTDLNMMDHLKKLQHRVEQIETKSYRVRNGNEEIKRNPDDLEKETARIYESYLEAQNALAEIEESIKNAHQVLKTLEDANERILMQQSLVMLEQAQNTMIAQAEQSRSQLLEISSDVLTHSA